LLRIHFTADDATRVRVVTLGPLAELQLSFGKFQQPANRPGFGGWRARTVAGARALSPDVRETARFLAPPAAGQVDLFTLVGPAGDLAEGIDRLCQVPAEPLRREFGFAPTVAGVRSGWLTDFAHGDRPARHRLTSALTAYYELAIEPYWPRIRALLDNERVALTDVLVTHGLGAMLASLAPALQWKAPVLQVPGHRGARPKDGPVPAVTDTHLGGRGLLLAPSLYADPDPGLFLPWHDGPPLLIYPIHPDVSTVVRLWQGLDEAGDRALTRLLGPTRAAALRAIADGCTTTGLARRLGISPGGASQHAAVLREAGLVVSHRHRNTVRHTLTGLGVNLLNAP
jgi:DNA-binding transcriptional ArsR family regulator